MRNSLKSVTVVVTSDGYTLPDGYSVKTVLSSSGTVVRYEETGGVVRFNGVDEGTKVVVYMSKADSGEDGELGVGPKADAVAAAGAVDLVSKYAELAYDPSNPKYRYTKCKNGDDIKNVSPDMLSDAYTITILEPEGKGVRKFGDTFNTYDGIAGDFVNMTSAPNFMSLESADVIMHFNEMDCLTLNLPSLKTAGNTTFVSGPISKIVLNCPSLVDGYELNVDYYGVNNLNEAVLENNNILQYGESMFAHCNKLSTFTGNLSALTNGWYMFYKCSELVSWDIDLPALAVGGNMFSSCTGLTSFKGDLPSLTNGSYMFHSCASLSAFSSDLSKMVNGGWMFCNCSALSSFNTDLPSVTNANYMFASSGIVTFESDMRSLKITDSTFDRCFNLKSFSGDLSSLTTATDMFFFCTSLTSFYADLPSLSNGSRMFNACKLNKTSVLRVLNTIPKYTSGTHTIGIGSSLTADEITSDTEVQSSIKKATGNGWTVALNDKTYRPS